MIVEAGYEERPVARDVGERGKFPAVGRAVAVVVEVGERLRDQRRELVAHALLLHDVLGYEALTVGASVDALIDKATGYGISYRSLYGVEEELADARSENKDFTYLAATDERGRILWGHGTRPDGLDAHSASPAALRIDIDEQGRTTGLR